jgi:hypothetical protein
LLMIYHKLTKKNPKNQHVHTMGRMPRVLSLPNVAPITGGTRLKKAPQPMPFNTRNGAKMPMLEARGQMMSELRLVKSRQTIRLLTGPSNESAVYPPKTRPTIDAKFHAASVMMEIWRE